MKIASTVLSCLVSKCESQGLSRYAVSSLTQSSTPFSRLIAVPVRLKILLKATDAQAIKILNFVRSIRLRCRQQIIQQAANLMGIRKGHTSISIFVIKCGSATTFRHLRRVATIERLPLRGRWRLLKVVAAFCDFAPMAAVSIF